MNIEYINKIAKDKMGKLKSHPMREKGFIYYHGLRTAKLALTLRKNIYPEISKYDDVIYAGALFHDIGKGIEPHQETGQVIVKHILEGQCTKQELDMVSEIVRLHCERKIPNDYPMWVRLVQDADILEHQGTSEIWINIAYSLYEERSYDYAIEWWQKNEKCLIEKETFPEKMNFDLSKKIWYEKVNFVDEFIKRLEEESEGKIFI